MSTTDTPKETKTMSKIKHSITHPDGSVSKRSSASRRYVAAVVVETPAASLAADARRHADGEAERIAQYEAALDAELVVTERDYSWGTSYSGSIGGIYVGSWGLNNSGPITREQAVESIKAGIASAVQRRDSWLAKAAKLDNAETSYSVVRWSQRRDSAESYLRSREGRYWQSNGRRAYIVDVEPQG